MDRGSPAHARSRRHSGVKIVRMPISRAGGRRGKGEREEKDGGRPKGDE